MGKTENPSSLLETMEENKNKIPNAKSTVSYTHLVGEFAPKISQYTIDPEKISEVIGKQGKTINGIIDETGVKIDIDESGRIDILSEDQAMIDKAISIIKSIVEPLNVGDIYEGEVVRIMNFGAFVQLSPNKDGMIHISKLSNERVEKVEDVVNIGRCV